MKGTKKLTSIIVLSLLITASSLSAAMAYEELPDIGYDFYYYDYGENQNMSSYFMRKQTNKSIWTNCHSASNSFTVHAIATTDYTWDEYCNEDILTSNRSYNDVSNGYRYTLWENESRDLYNWAYEWGYPYAGIEGSYSGEDFSASGAFNVD